MLLVEECPFMTAAESQEALEAPFSNASICLDERCAEGKEKEGLEDDGGGALEKRVFIRFYYYLHYFFFSGSFNALKLR